VTDARWEILKDRPFFCSWSGGKDSCLALYRAIQQGGRPCSLLTMLSEDGLTTHSHGLPRQLIEEQAECLSMNTVFRHASWQQYEEEFISALREIKQAGIDVGVFGDIDLDEHRDWVLRVCTSAGITPVHPLWKQDRRGLLEEFIDLGFTAQVIVVNENMLDRQFLGQFITKWTITGMEKAGIDPAGELGEYHTVVTNGPIFSHEVKIHPEETALQEGYWFLKVRLRES